MPPVHEAYVPEVPSTPVVAPVDVTDTQMVFGEPEHMDRLSVEEIVSYRLNYGEMPPDYAELSTYDRVLVQNKLREQATRETAKSSESEVSKKPERARGLGWDDEELWKEDEDEYRLYGDTGVNIRDDEEDRDEDSEKWI